MVKSFFELYFGTIHLRRRQIFRIFDLSHPLLQANVCLHSSKMSLSPPPTKKQEVDIWYLLLIHKWMVPYTDPKKHLNFGQNLVITTIVKMIQLNVNCNFPGHPSDIWFFLDNEPKIIFHRTNWT